MDNGEEERAVVDRLKQTVKHTSRRQATKKSSKQRDPIIRIAPNSASASVKKIFFWDWIRPPASRSLFFRSWIIRRERRFHTVEWTGCKRVELSVSLRESDLNWDPPPPEHGDHLVVRSIPPISADDSVLLMHFLDNVFPLQYPMYKSGILEGGRGWLLTLLLRVKPLYHAALALRAYHRRSVILAKVSHPYQDAALVLQKSIAEFA